MIGAYVQVGSGLRGPKGFPGYVIHENGCWQWLGAIIPPYGYGRLRVGARMEFAHRIMYQRAHGGLPIPPGLVIDHLCNNPACVNPDHLKAVTQRENVLRTNSFSAVNFRKTHCIRGHEFSPDNTFTPTNKAGRGCRACRTWHSERQKGLRKRRKK